MQALNHGDHPELTDGCISLLGLCQVKPFKAMVTGCWLVPGWRNEYLALRIIQARASRASRKGKLTRLGSSVSKGKVCVLNTLWKEGPWQDM